MLMEAYALARQLHPDVVQNWAGFCRLLGITSQRLNNWKKRGIPKGELFSIADRLGVSVELIRRAAAPVAETHEDDVTDQEAALLAAFRQADEQTRAAIFTLATRSVAISPRSIAKPNPRVIAIKGKSRQ